MSNIEVSRKLDDLIRQSSEVMDIANHFEKAMTMAHVVGQLKNELSKPEVISALMPLQGLNIGFLTDSKLPAGYPLQVVIDCMIEAVMQGVYPTGNEFNIIAGKCYITKNGMKRKLENLGYIKNIKLKFIDYKENGNYANVKMLIDWHDSRTNENHSESLSLLVKSDRFSTCDNILGKATRKARAWLFENVTGESVPDGDAEMVDYKDITEQQKPIEKKLNELIEGSETWNKVVEKLLKGTAIDTVKEYYIVSPELEIKLNSIIEEETERLINEESKNFEK